MTQQVAEMAEATAKTNLELRELARSMHHEPADMRTMKKSVLEPLTYLLAEFRYLGLSNKAMYEFVKRTEVKITYAGMCEWAKRHLGEESGPNSRAEKVIRRGIELGEFSSPHLPGATTELGSLQQSTRDPAGAVAAAHA